MQNRTLARKCVGFGDKWSTRGLRMPSEWGRTDMKLVDGWIDEWFETMH
jgi:hypothetical protein